MANERRWAVEESITDQYISRSRELICQHCDTSHRKVKDKMESVSKCIIFALLVVLSVAQNESPVVALNESSPTNSSSTQAKPLSCLRSYGITANWQDETCSSYFVCDNFVLRVIQCEEGRAFSIMEHACVERSLVDCDEQNNAVRLNLRAAAILRETSDPSYVVPDLDNEDPNNPLSEDARVGAMLHSLRNPGAGRTKRAALKALGVPTSTESIETINITLPDSICDRIDAETVIIEALMNAILLTESGCRDLTCGIPLFSLLCREYNDSQDEAPNNSTMAATSANLIQLDTNSTLFTDGGISGSDGVGVNNTLTAGNGTSSANNDSAPSNIFGIFDVPENNGNRISETSDVSRQQGQGNGNSN